MHLHLDLVGGISGDMFISAMLDCYPALANELPLQIDKAGFSQLVSLAHEKHNDGIISGSRFTVTAGEDAESHHHRHYSEIKRILETSRLDERTKQISLDIFHIIAVAEAAIHDKEVENIAFHEVGAWDSIADVICAAYLIATTNIKSSSCSALPLGGGQVKTAHGMLPIPAPATTLILAGFEFFDDGVKGERITPTGAAILKYLNPSTKPIASLKHQGMGFGTKVMPGISNVLRLLIMEPKSAVTNWQTETIHTLEFEIDDQTPEQLAAGINQLQQMSSVVDVIQYPVTGKKNRLSHAVRVLCKVEDRETVIQACFQLTTTLGIRESQSNRHVLRRQEKSVEIDGSQYRVKIADRPGGRTIKAEMDDLADQPSLAAALRLRQQLETAASDDVESNEE